MLMILQMRSNEFVESVKGDILGANVYVFTPKGEVIELPKGCNSNWLCI